MINKAVAVVRGVARNPEFERKHPRNKGKFTRKQVTEEAAKNRLGQPTNFESLQSDRIKKAIEGNRSALAKIGRGVPVSMLEKNLRNIISKARISVARPYESLAGLLKHGRLSTLFDAPDSILDKLPAATDKGRRAELEYETTGVPLDVKKSERTIYGSLMDKDFVATNSLMYGDIVYVLKPSVDDRTTVTVGDSLNGYLNIEPTYPNTQFMPSPKTNPRFYSVAPEYGRAALEAKSVTDLAMASDDEYIEAQIRGGVRVEDIAEIRSYGFVPNENEWKYFEKEFGKRGIKLIRVTEDMYQ